MKILFASSEVAPYVKSGGLGDVAGALPKALASQGTDIRVICPLYQDISDSDRSRMTFLKVVWIPLAWRTQYCGVFELKENGVTYYFLDNKFYFGRRNLYGFFDDAERFAFFCRASLEILQHIDFMPDLIHCNDWQTALIPVYLEELYRNRVPGYEDIRTLFTIHNIQYQGKFSPDVTEYVFGLPYSLYEEGILRFDNCVNLMKAAIVYSFAVSTVSPTYAEEIRTVEYGHGLHVMLEAEKDKLHGILNGIDQDVYAPKKDPHIFAHYSKTNPAGKAENKQQIQQVLGLNVNPDVPVIAIISRLVDHKGMDLIRQALDRILDQNVQLIVLGTGDYVYEEMFRDASSRYAGKVSANITFNFDLAQKVYAAADLFLMPSQSEPCGLSQLIAMRYGTIPVVRKTGGLKDTVVPYREENGKGCGFVFEEYSAEALLTALGDAIRLWGDPRHRKSLIANTMSYDSGWTVSASRYLELYRTVTGIAD